ncbi:hypothetical protein ACPPVT_07640 [Angustibacter sp. McL0619]|uniref:hypothetical protein n=1 Tax=Angustibacter sp. McL0619 TaxID=3415676 RepID=UPI003CED5F53
MTAQPSANDFLLGGGGRSASFLTVGATAKGQIVSTPEVRQKTKMGTGDLETWDDGSPKLQLVVTLATDERDPADAEDDGVRKLYVGGSKKPESKSMHAAVAAAVIASGAKGLEVGGTLQVTYVGDGTSKTAGFNPPKQYQAVYTPAAAGFLGTDQAQSAAAPAVAPAAAPATGPAPQDITTAKSLIAAGLDDATVLAAAPSLTAEVVAALRNAA